jgi:hypothetical protein
MQRHLSNRILLCPYGLLVIRPKTLLADHEVSDVLPHLASLPRGEQLHLSAPHCTAIKDYDEGADLFMIDACTECSAPTAN